MDMYLKRRFWIEGMDLKPEADSPYLYTIMAITHDDTLTGCSTAETNMDLPHVPMTLKAPAMRQRRTRYLPLGAQVLQHR